MKMKRSITLACFASTLLVLSACSEREEGVYGEPIPDPADTAAIERITRQLPAGEDRAMWSNIKMRLTAADELGIESKSVREAIKREKLRSACMKENSGSLYDKEKQAKAKVCSRGAI